MWLSDTPNVYVNTNMTPWQFKHKHQRLPLTWKWNGDLLISMSFYKWCICCPQGWLQYFPSFILVASNTKVLLFSFQDFVIPWLICFDKTPPFSRLLLNVNRIFPHIIGLLILKTFPFSSKIFPGIKIFPHFQFPVNILRFHDSLKERFTEMRCCEIGRRSSDHPSSKKFKKNQKVLKE